MGSPRRRCLGLLLAVLVVFGAVTARLVQLQVVSPGDYAARGMAQRLRDVVLPAERGSIFDRNGQELALSVPQHTVWADPRQVVDPVAAAAALAPVLGRPREELEVQLAREGSFVYLARQVGDELAAAVERLALPGVHLVEESKRFAPAGSLAASVLGETDVDNLGVSGLEKQYEASLVGIPGSLSSERGADGSTIAGGSHHLVPSKRGLDLVLTIDRSLQFEVEQALVQQVAATGAEGGTAVVMDPTTGEILAMANIGRDGAGNPVPIKENRAVTAVFEPGSVNKVITVAAGIEEGLFEPDTVLTVPDTLKVSIKDFSDHEPHPDAQWSVSDILTQSSNVGTIMLAQRLGHEKVSDYLTRFGLGQPSGLGFPQETRGITRQRWDSTDIGSIPIGQGVAVNALQMLQTYNTLANGGVWVQPRLVKATVDAEGDERPAPASKSRRVVSEETADKLTAMLSNVVNNGTGVNARIQGYTVAGKTGTARKNDLVNGGYESGAYFASFAGFVPAESPRLSALVVLDEPRPTYYAGVVVAPVFARISQYALRTLRIPPPAATGSLADVPETDPVSVELPD
ncbi:MAG: peptidoglycan D,D-transpeptidase FtsI family protein [Acidimicrobiia bacterium]